MERVRVAVAQMTSRQDIGANLSVAESLIAEAEAAGAQWIALPENFAYMRAEGGAFPCAQDLDGEIVTFLRDCARSRGMWILGGSFPEAREDERVHNTSVLISDHGELIAVYRKIHLFDVDLRDRGGAAFEESKRIAPGRAPVVARTPFGAVGLSVCYDVRFPELYRGYARAGCSFLTVPSAFAPETGRDHWEVLLRARAIENQAFVLAPAQIGDHGGGRHSHGEALLIDPWGSILARAPDRPCVVVADCDLERQEALRERIPALRHRAL